MSKNKNEKAKTNSPDVIGLKRDQNHEEITNGYSQ